MMRDDALAPVVAMMLILAVVVTLFSLWNSVYLPGLKQQAEIEHLSQVEEAMERMDSAISDALYYQRDGSLSVPLPLGGGDIMFNNVRSGGVLRINQRENPIMNITIKGISHYAYLSSITYTPVSNFWIPQGYSWQYGSLNVNKGTSNSNTSLGLNATREIEQFSKSLLPPPEKHGDLEITYANITAGRQNTTSGNGIASLNLDAVKTPFPPIPDVDEITVEFAEDQDLPETFKEKLTNSTNNSLSSLQPSSYSQSGNIHTFGFNPAIESVTINRLELILSVE